MMVYQKYSEYAPVYAARSGGYDLLGKDGAYCFVPGDSADIKVNGINKIPYASNLHSTLIFPLTSPILPAFTSRK